MDESPDVTPPLVAAPRHLRRRRLHEEIPDTLLVPGAEPVVAAPPRAGRRTPSPSVKPRSSDAAARSYRRKRLVAMGLMILVSVSVLCLVLALLLNG